MCRCRAGILNDFSAGWIAAALQPLLAVFCKCPKGQCDGHVSGAAMKAPPIEPAVHVDIRGVFFEPVMCATSRPRADCARILFRIIIRRCTGHFRKKTAPDNACKTPKPAPFPERRTGADGGIAIPGAAFLTRPGRLFLCIICVANSGINPAHAIFLNCAQMLRDKLMCLRLGTLMRLQSNTIFYKRFHASRSVLYSHTAGSFRAPQAVACRVGTAGSPCSHSW